MTRKRGRNQELEEESRSALRTALKSWVVNDLHNDFGLDFVVQLAQPDNGEYRKITPLSCYIQLKASERFSETDMIYWDFDVDFVESYWNCSVPVVLMLYEADTQSFYWTVLQQYVHEHLITDKPEWWSQNTIRISIDRTETLQDIDEFGKHLSEATRRIEQRRLRHIWSRDRLGTQTRGDSVGHLVDYQISLVERAEQNLDENKDAVKALSS